MILRYLDFDHSEDGEGGGTWDAMASVTGEHVEALHAEIAAVLDWAHGRFGSQRGPIEEDGEWDYDLQAVEETSTGQSLRYDEERRRVVAEPGATGAPRHTVTLSLCGTRAFCEAFRERFGLE
ncbi:hypothetical protein [Paracidovorax avenae]|uniref:hypothetical protein n=1 Tax=Paracidovorax avenae TaxID=80867 RepID=UPI000D17B6B3|nr:hypothetical protein [Paracidovorax avenae]AVS85571.1 hypothetical protein C8239_13095 [Paracidovorax avenae]AVS89078.1 hypothetical protein C8238_13235 [Paracidovorax avenae]AVS96442.1 hypothetical protein C8232_09380 [Paracidovorax avenae]AVT03271.1 hypothetical protein C8243_12810 [Paracidovorax avenae]AVT10221.1 hypothetical protein C8242_12570 [Paracidovorax avenae]